jgi:hypothetical protein
MGGFLKETMCPKRLMKIKVELNLIVELIMDGFLRVSTFPRLN